MPARGKGFSAAIADPRQARSIGAWFEGSVFSSRSRPGFCVSVTGHSDPEALIDAARSAAPIIREHALDAEQAGRMSATVIDALLERGLFRLWVPEAYGGVEIDLVSALRVYEILSEADGAAGWTVMIGAGAGWFGGFLDPVAATEIFAPAEAVIAGSGAPTGIACPEPGGYRVSGRWSYASGAHHATWFTANCSVEGRKSADGSGAPLIRSIAVPAAAVRIHETWSVTGMRGTGSDDIEIEDIFVPDTHVFSAFDDAPREAGPLYRVPFATIAELAFAAVALGVARNAMHEFRELARNKRPMGATTALLDDTDVQARYAHAEGAVGSARAFTFDLAAQAWETVSRGDAIDVRDQARIRLAAVDTVHRCAAAIDLLQARAGMSPLHSESVFGRAWQDLHAITQNAVVSAGLYAGVGRELLGYS